MSGHSKWANIKHKKANADKQRAKIFTRLAKEIMVAAKHGGGDVDSNPRLRHAVAAAKNVNMPNANIDRAIKKATGERDSVIFEDITYEGYGAGGVAILIECLTDNRNRTAGEIRSIFDKSNGNLAGTGAVSWIFKRKSHFVITGENADEEKLFNTTVDAGAENIEIENDVAEIYGAPDAFEKISKALQSAGIAVEESGIIQSPENIIEIKETSVARQVLTLIEKLEELDDVQAVYANFDIPQNIIEEVGK
jgi:YebC/PmpR family DNA-binding regulatory protein